MLEKMIHKLRKLLLNQRRDIFEMLFHLESDLKTLEERDIDAVDSAQKESLYRMLNQLDVRGKKELNEIDLALDRMTTGTYGVCELCRKQIALKRLTLIPATRLCRRCAQEYENAQEKRQRPRNEIIDNNLLEEYRNLYHEEVPLTVFKHSLNESVTDMEEV